MNAQSRSSSLAAVLAAVSLFSFTGMASGQTPCGRHDDIAAALKSKYQEARRIMGVINARTVMEIFTSEKGTWTVLVTDTTGRSCITATGEAWQELPLQVAGLDS